MCITSPPSSNCTEGSLLSPSGKNLDEMKFCNSKSWTVFKSTLLLTQNDVTSSSFRRFETTKHTPEAPYFTGNQTFSWSGVIFSVHKGVDHEKMPSICKFCISLRVLTLNANNFLSQSPIITNNSVLLGTTLTWTMKPCKRRLRLLGSNHLPQIWIVVKKKKPTISHYNI